jgi:indole-3-glycerol phosphate synthase
MSDFLATILEHKKMEIRAAVRMMPEKYLRVHAGKANGKRSFYNGLASPGPFGMNIIAEIKRASPSKGPIRDRVDPKVYAGMYTRGGAAAISVLTDAKFFGGSPVDLREARGAAGVPVWRKDFLISPYQIYESAVIGADAVLLIVRALSPELLREFISLCDTVGLDALVEVHNEAELETAMSAGARLIGINNRDLVTFRTDIKTSINLARLVGHEHVVVSESGIHGREEIERLLEAGIFNFLIGESLMRSEDPESHLKVLHGAEP